MSDSSDLEGYREEYIPASKEICESQVSIGFSDLSFWLQVLVVCGWIMVALNVAAFFVGFVVGMLEVV